MEEWKTLVYQGIEYPQFEASNLGKLRNKNTGTVYKLCINKNGYYQVCVSLGSTNEKKLFRIHRCVAETFIPRVEDKLLINHKDGVKLNNDYRNLEWVTNAENTQHAIDTGLLVIPQGTDHCCSKLTKEQVQFIRANYVSGDREFGARALSKQYGVHHSTIVDAFLGNTYPNI